MTIIENYQELLNKLKTPTTATNDGISLKAITGAVKEYLVKSTPWTVNDICYGPVVEEVADVNQAKVYIRHKKSAYDPPENPHIAKQDRKITYSMGLVWKGTANLEDFLDGALDKLINALLGMKIGGATSVALVEERHVKGPEEVPVDSGNYLWIYDVDVMVTVPAIYHTEDVVGTAAVAEIGVESNRVCEGDGPITITDESSV